jgi:hypothetical protein
MIQVVRESNLIIIKKNNSSHVKLPLSLQAICPSQGWPCGQFHMSLCSLSPPGIPFIWTYGNRWLLSYNNNGLLCYMLFCNFCFHRRWLFSLSGYLLLPQSMEFIQVCSIDKHLGSFLFFITIMIILYFFTLGNTWCFTVNIWLYKYWRFSVDFLLWSKELLWQNSPLELYVLLLSVF